MSAGTVAFILNNFEIFPLAKVKVSTLESWATHFSKCIFIHEFDLFVEVKF